MMTVRTQGTRLRAGLVGMVTVVAMIVGLAVISSESVSAQTFDVTSKACLGPGSITQAVADANAHPGADVISFTPGLVVDASSCPNSTNTPGFSPSTYFLAKVTESVVFEGNGARLQGRQYWIDRSGNQSFGSCPKDVPGTLVVADTPGFLLVGRTLGADNTGVEVTVRNLDMDQLNSVAGVRKNAKLTISGSHMSNISRVVGCGGDGIIGVHEGTLSMLDSEIRLSYNWNKSGPILGSAGFIQVEGRLDMLRTTMQYNAYAYAVAVSGTANIVSSQLISTGGLSNIGPGSINMVNSTLFFNDGVSGLDRISQQSGTSTTNIKASTISVPSGRCTSAACIGTGYTAVPFAAIGGSINLQQSAIGVRNTAGATSKVIETHDVLGSVTADAKTWIQPVAGQDAAALRTLTGQASLLTDAPGLLTNAYDAEYLPSVTPLLGTVGTPGVLIDAIPDAGTGGTNELKSPIDGSPITTDVFGNPRVDGSGARSIGAVQQNLAPHLQVDAVGDRSVTLSWTLPKDPPGGPITGYGILHRPRGSSGSWSRVDVTGAGMLSQVVSGLTNGTDEEFEVVAVASGTDGPPSNVTTAVPMGPITRPLVDATAGVQSVQLSWTETDCGGRSGSPYYQVLLRTAGGGDWEAGPLSLSGRITTIPDLVGGQEYEFGVVAVCGNGESSSRGIATATPLAPPDPDPGPDPDPSPEPTPSPTPPIVPNYTG